jgi:hypothetical protein
VVKWQRFGKKMEYVIVEIKEFRFLCSVDEQLEPLLNKIPEIEVLAKDCKAFIMNALHETREAGQKLDERKAELMGEIGYNIIGFPFTNHEAISYAHNKKLSYTILELN